MVSFCHTFGKSISGLYEAHSFFIPIPLDHSCSKPLNCTFVSKTGIADEGDDYLFDCV